MKIKCIVCNREILDEGHDPMLFQRKEGDKCCAWCQRNIVTHVAHFVSSQLNYQDQIEAEGEIPLGEYLGEDYGRTDGD